MRAPARQNVHSAHGWREVLDPVVARYCRTSADCCAVTRPSRCPTWASSTRFACPPTRCSRRRARPLLARPVGRNPRSPRKAAAARHGRMLTLDGGNGSQPGSRCVRRASSGCRRRVGRHSETARAPVAGVNAVLPRPGGQEKACLHGRKRGIPRRAWAPSSGNFGVRLRERGRLLERNRSAGAVLSRVKRQQFNHGANGLR
jgi:hypothetical protein